MSLPSLSSLPVPARQQRTDKSQKLWDPEQAICCARTCLRPGSQTGSLTKVLVPSPRPLCSQGPGADRLTDAEATASVSGSRVEEEGRKAAASWAPTWSLGPGWRPWNPRRLLPFPAQGYLRTAGQELRRPPEKWQLALGTPKVSAFSRAPGELGGPDTLLPGM
jgi:hypothetical protein